MYGLVNKAIKDLVEEKFGTPTWRRIAEAAGFKSDEFLSMEPYDDDLTYRLVKAGCAELKMQPKDLLSAFGDPKRTGKPLGNDLRAGKRTLLLIEALKRARGKERALLQSVVGNAKAKEADLRRALSVMDDCGARAAIEARVSVLKAEALNALGSGLTPEGKTLLTGAIQALTERRA